MSITQDPLVSGGESFFSSLDDHWFIVLDNNSRKRFTAEVSLNSSGISRDVYVVDAADTGRDPLIPVKGWSIRTHPCPSSESKGRTLVSVSPVSL
jgi:hypothetical protein